MSAVVSSKIPEELRDELDDFVSHLGVSRNKFIRVMIEDAVSGGRAKEVAASIRLADLKSHGEKCPLCGRGQ